MKNVPMSKEEFSFFRQWVRGYDILWRDMRTNCLVPNWGEAVCLKDFMIGSVTSGEYAYNVLKNIYPTLKLHWIKSELSLLDARPPMYYQNRLEGELYYLDIKSAYLQLYQYLYLHSKAPFRRQQYPLYDVAQCFVNHSEIPYKAARNAIVGIARSTRNKWVCGSKIWYTTKYNRYLSPTLWYQLMGILNQFARAMLAIGAVWFNVDGYIFQSIKSYELALDFFRERGIAIGHSGFGVGIVSGLNNVHIPGVKETKLDEPSKPVHHLENSNIDFYMHWNDNRRKFI